jgi:epoxyqueuosine reductase
MDDGAARPAAARLADALRAEALRIGFDAVGIAPVRPSEHAAFYQRWIEAGRHGSMSYLARPDAVERRVRPAGFASAVVVALNYYTPDPDAVAATDPARGIIARYARGRDYHKVLKKKLLRLLAWLETELGRELPAARAYVDTGPVLERELAQRAGLGWFGRSTMLLHPRRGSYFFLGSLLLDVELEPDAPFEADHCGTCTACVDACPTGALLGRDGAGAPVIDATRCISYLTIENRGAIPRELRPLMGNRVFGCDICQEVCPWNSSKFVQITGVADFDPGRRERDRERFRDRVRELRGELRELPGTSSPSLISLMWMTCEEWDEWTRGSAIRRAGYAGFRRNVAVALGNWAATAGEPPSEVVAVLADALSDPEPLVRRHAAWALGRIGSAEARSALSDRASAECDVSVLEELAVAMEA